MLFSSFKIFDQNNSIDSVELSALEPECMKSCMKSFNIVCVIQILLNILYSQDVELNSHVLHGIPIFFCLC